MAYIERLRDAVYISPTGVIFTLEFEELSISGSKKVAIHEYPNQSVSDIQDLGNNAMRLPVSVFFTGENYDLFADSFKDALSESGAAEFRHPRYGNLKVLPLSWTLLENFVDRMREGRFNIDFIIVPDRPIFPAVQVNSQSTVEQQITSFADVSSRAFSLGINTDTVSLEISLETFILAQINSLVARLRSLAESVENLRTDFDNFVNGITGAIDALIAIPETLGNLIIDIFRLLAPSTSSTADKQEAYEGLIEDYTNSLSADAITNTTNIDDRNKAFTNQLFLHGCLAGITETSFYTDYQSRTDAINWAEFIEAQREIINSYLEGLQEVYEDNQSDDKFVIDQASTEDLEQAVSIANNYLIELSFELRLEKKITTESPRAPIELIYALTGNYTDDLLDEFIETNNLTDDEIFLIPPGREITYFE